MPEPERMNFVNQNSDDQIGGGKAKSIRVFQTQTADPATLYRQWETAHPEFSSQTWRAWQNIESAPVEAVTGSSIPSVTISHLARWCLPVFPDNPHTHVPAKGEVEVLFDTTTYAATSATSGGKSAPKQKTNAKREFTKSKVEESAGWRGSMPIRWRIAEDETVAVGAIELTYRARCGAPAPSAQLRVGRPYPQYRYRNLPMGPVRVTAEFDTAIKEINAINNWYAAHVSMVPAVPVLVESIVPVKAKAKFDLRPFSEAVAKLQPYAEIRIHFPAADMYQLNGDDDLFALQQTPQNERIVSAWRARQEALRTSQQHRMDEMRQQRELAVRDYVAADVAKGKTYGELTAAERAQADKIVARRDARQGNTAADGAMVAELRRVTAALARHDAVKLRTMRSHLTHVCGHYRTLIDAALRNDFEMNAAAATTAREWAEHVPVNYKYYCRECGELLMTDDLTEFSNFTTGNAVSTAEHDPIHNYIISEAIQAFRRARFARPPNLRALAVAIADVLEPRLLAVQTDLQKSKTRSLQDTQQITVIYASIYSFAMVCRMIIESPKLIVWNTTEHVAKSNRAIAALNTAYALVVDANQTRLTAVKDFTSDQIKPALIEAYKWSGDVRYAVDAKSTDGPMVADEGPGAAPRDPWTDLCGRWNIISPAFRGAFEAVAPGEQCEGMPMISRVPAVADTPWLRALKYTNAFLTERIWAEGEGELTKQWRATWDPTLTADDAAHYQSTQMLRLQPWIPTPTQLITTKFASLPISLIRCPTGEIHQFGLRDTVYMIGKKRYRFNELTAGHGRITDELCGRCGMSASARPRDITKSLDHVRGVDAFYTYYQNRCPQRKIGDLSTLHEWPEAQALSASAPCRHCAYQREWAYTRPEAYYRRWHTHMPRHTALVEPWTPAPAVRVDVAPEKWSVTLTSMLTLANQSGIPYNLWINLGLSERELYGALKQGTLNPSSTIEDPARLIARAEKVAGMAMGIERAYQAVRHNARFSIGPVLKETLEKDAGELASAPDRVVPEGFIEGLYRHIYGGTKPGVICNYALHAVCAALLAIRGSKAAHRTLRHLADYLTEQIMTGERLVSRLELRKMQVATTTAADDALVQAEDLELVTEDASIEDAEPTDPFSLEGFDIETTNMGNEDEEQMD